MKSIQFKLTVMILAIFIVALSALGGLNYWKAREMLVNDLMKNMGNKAEDSATMAGDWLNMRKAELAMIAVAPVLKKGDVAESVAFLANAVQNNHDYISIGYILPNGDMFHSAGTQENVVDREYFKQAISGKTFISDPLVSRSNGHLVTVVSIPVKNGEQVVGAIAGAVDMEGFAAKILAVKVEQTGFAYVMQKNGLTIVHPDQDIAMKSNPLQDHNLSSSIVATAERMVNGEKGVVRYDYKGVEKAVAFAPIPGMNWSLAVAVPVTEVTSEVSVLTTISFMTGVIILIVAGLLIRWYARRIARPIEQLEQAADRIAGGDLSIVQIDINSRDEIGRLGRSFIRMTDQLRKLVQNINLTADHVVTSSEQFSANASQSAEAANQVAVSIVHTAEGTDKQSKTIHNVLQWMEEITTGAQQAVLSAQHELDITKRAVEKAIAGNSAADTAVNQMNTIRTTVDGSAKVVLELSEHSKQIGNIVETISSIAGQTNLLALNAAIEAARAGEQGKGFAVVAEEVRKLAEESENATKQIATLISDIQIKTEHAVQTMMAGAEAVEQGTNIVGEAGVAFKNIVSEVQQVAELSQTSVNSQNHMAESSDKILDAMKNIDTISLDIAKQSTDISAATEEQSAAMEEIAASSQSLTRLSGDLKDMVQQFKI